MTRYWPLSVPLLLISIIILIFYIRANPLLPEQNQKRKEECLINEKTAALLGEMYKLTDPMNDPNHLVNYIHRHWEYFLEDGLLIQTARVLGNWMLQQDKFSLDLRTIQQFRPKLEDCNLTSNYAYEILLHFRKSNVSFKELGNELIWLSDVLPLMAKGELYPYLTSGTNFRNNFKQFLPIYTALHNSDPEIAELILHDRNYHYQVNADLIRLFAVMSEL